MVPKKEVWIRKVSETKAYRAGRVPESDGWSARMVPGSEWCQKNEPWECWKSSGKRRLG